jgi:hypothetical protein
VLDLVGHGVGQGGDGAPGTDHVAVAVEQPVELGEREGAVPPQDGDAGDAEVAAAEGLSPLGGGGQRAAVDVGRAAALRPRHRRVEALAQVRQRVDDGSSLLGDADEAVVELLQPMDEGVALGLDLHARPEVEAGCPPEVVDAAAPERVDRVGGPRLRWRQIGVRIG